jgi:acyl-CoA synthetase (NDP forming)
MMGQTEVWKALYAQTGAVPVTSLEEMAEITQAFLFLKPTQGKRAAVLGMGGGGSVHAADACVREGLEVPVLSKTTQTELKKFIPVTGGSVRNPLDCGPVQVDSSLMARGMELLAADPSVDLLVCMPHLNITLEAGAEQVEKLVNFLSDFARNNPYRKPVVIVFNSFVDEPWENKLRVRLANELAREGVAVYESLTAAARALACFTGYHRFISRRM